MNPKELEFAASFVAPEKKERWRELLDSKRGRAKLLQSLPHNPDFDQRFSKPVAALSSADALADLLRSKGSPDLVHIISESAALDGSELPLRAAVSKVFAGSMGSVIICIPDRLAWYEAEIHRESLLLERGAG
jgi:hypothetical protein